MLVGILISLLTAILMEAFAWLTHKYVMHGFMWRWHESHHVFHKNKLEKNDYFSLVFGILATLLIIFGDLNPNLSILFWVGIGVSIYGILYFVFHDIIVHRRLKVKFNSKNKYLKMITKAHHIHHKVHTKGGAEAFGFLYASKKYKNL